MLDPSKEIKPVSRLKRRAKAGLGSEARNHGGPLPRMRIQLLKLNLVACLGRARAVKYQKSRRSCSLVDRSSECASIFLNHCRLRVFGNSSGGGFGNGSH